METTSNMKGFWSWGIFIVIVGLVIWGLVAAQQKAARQEANLVLPDQIVATDHVKGSTTAPVTLVEYGDFQCPACGIYHPIVENVIASTSPDTLRFVFRHFPLPQHGNAMPASQAAEAAGNQGKFWEMYNILYDHQKDWETASEPQTVFITYANTLGLDLVKFSEDYALKATKDRINNDYRGGAKAGVNSTPTFFVNGKKITNPSTYAEFKKIIDDAALAPAV